MPACPNCGLENPEGFRFCGFCGGPLEERPTSLSEERKVVTVLFCDMVGFTAASDQADPEEVRALIRPYHALLRQEIERYGGTVEKFIGDAVMAVFGAPIAHEDDPERTVRAGLRILEAIADHNEAGVDLDLQVRVGIETGEAVVALDARPQAGEGIVTGDVVNTASRLQGAAPVNGVAVGEGTYQATKEIFDYEAMEPVVLKGKAEPVSLWQAKASRSRFGADLTRKLTTPMVGRQIDLGILTGSFQKAVQEHTVQLVTIVGEPGVGKSRVVGELFSFVDAQPDVLIRWRQGRCLPYGDAVTFWALGDIVKAEAGILETDSLEVAGSKIDLVVPDKHPDAPWLRQRLRPLVGLEAPQAAREENFAAWRAFLELLAEDAPSVFVFEDLHWADDALLLFIEHLAEYAEGVPMLIVGTARPELLEKAPTWAATARNSHRINLSPLTEAETAKLVSNLLESTVLPAAVPGAILARFGGNPLYAEEFVRLLKDRGVLTRIDGTWRLEEGSDVPLPAGVQGLISARLDTLSPKHKRLLQDAAVIGTVFWSGAVAEMGEQDPDDVRQALHELSRKELVRPARVSSMAGESEYAFHHSLVRDVCYAQIPRAHRAERHVRAASWIEKTSRERVEDHAEILAAHFSSALELARSAKNADTSTMEKKAIRYLTLAGDRAIGMDVEAAERHYARALAMVAQDHPARPEILARHGAALLQRGRFPESASLYEQAIEGFRSIGDIHRLATAMGGYSLALYQMGDPRANDVTAEALAMVEPLGPSPELVQALTEEAGTRFVSMELSQAIALADRAIALASELELPVPARALGFLGGARAAAGDADGVKDMRAALEAAVAQGLGREGALVYNNLSEALWSIDGPRGRLDSLAEGSAFAERRGIEEFVLSFDAATLETLVDLGRYDQAMALAGPLLARLEKAEDVLDRVVVRSSEVRLLTRRGLLAEAASRAEWSLARAREVLGGQPEYLAKVWPMAAGLSLAFGNPVAAAELLLELERTPNVEDSPYYPAALPEIVRIALGTSDAELAARLAKRVEPKYAMHEHAVVMAKALLAEFRGEHAEAVDLFADAVQRWRDFEMPWELGQALLGRGRCLLTLGAGVEATETLQQAREVFGSLGAEPALRDIDVLLGRATALHS